jgi:hypothetical protein
MSKMIEAEDPVLIGSIVHIVDDVERLEFAPTSWRIRCEMFFGCWRSAITFTPTRSPVTCFVCLGASPPSASDD